MLLATVSMQTYAGVRRGHLRRNVAEATHSKLRHLTPHPRCHGTSWQHSGATVLLITHSHNEAEKLHDWVASVGEGEVLADRRGEMVS